MLTDTQIETLCKKMDIPLEAIVFKDEMPYPLKYNRSYFVNLENSKDKDGVDNQGSHWCCLQVNKYKNGNIEPFWFDPYGMPAPEEISKYVKDQTGQVLPYNKRDIQSLLNNACGYYCCALLHYVNAFSHRSRDFYEDINCFLEMFDDLNVSTDFKKNEYILKHFFQSKDPKLRKVIDIDTIDGDDVGGGIDMMKIPVDFKTIDMKKVR
jgi:hypothetical protein